MIKSKRNMGGLDPKHWTRWRYFKEIQLHFAWESFKFFGMCIVTLLVLVITFLIVAPRVIYKEWRESKWQRTTQ